MTLIIIGILDGNEEITYQVENEESGVTLEVKGDANVSDTIITTQKIKDLEENNSIVGPVYNFNTEGNLKEANVEIKYDDSELVKSGIEEQNLSLYYFNTEDYSFELIETQIDSENNTAKAKLNHFSMYVLADKSTMATAIRNEIIFLIDNSGSMYTPEQGFEKSLNIFKEEADFDHFPGNDPEYKRLELVSNIINKLDENYKFGIAKFTMSSSMLSEIQSNKDKANEALEKIKTNGEYFTGTYIASSITDMIYRFTQNDGATKYNRYIVLITDGVETDELSETHIEEAIEKAKEENIKIITIGIGNEVDYNYLKRIANSTGGKYFYANDADALNGIYDTLYSTLNLNRVTFNEGTEDEEDYIIIADSGFDPSTNGLPFKNYITSLAEGQCYGIAEFVRRYYMGTLELNSEKTQNIDGNKGVYGYDLTGIDLFKNNQVLSSFKFKNEAIGKLLFSTNADRLDYEKLDEDYKNGCEELHLNLKEEYKELIKETGGVISFKEEEREKEKYGKIIAEIMYVDMDKINDEMLENFPDLQLLKAIEYYYGFQFNEDGKVNEEKDIIINNSNNFKELIEEIYNGNPVILSFETKGSNSSFIEVLRYLMKSTNHSINGIQVLQSTEKENTYKIAAYNNNYVGETQYFVLTGVKLLNGNVHYFVKCESDDELLLTNLYMVK